MLLQKNLAALSAAALLVVCLTAWSAHAQSDLVFISSHDYVDEMGRYHIVGEIQNNSDDVVKLVEVTAELYDSDNISIGRTFAYTFIDVIRPQEKSAFHLVVTDSAQISQTASYKLSVDVGVITSDKHRMLDLKIGNSYHDGLVYHLAGEVTNNAENLARFVEVSAAFYDDNGNLVDTAVGFTNPQNLEPGETAPFELLSTSPDAGLIREFSANAESSEYAATPEFPPLIIVILAAIIGGALSMTRLSIFKRYKR